MNIFKSLFKLAILFSLFTPYLSFAEEALMDPNGGDPIMMEPDPAAPDTNQPDPDITYTKCVTIVINNCLIDYLHRYKWCVLVSPHRDIIEESNICAAKYEPWREACQRNAPSKCKKEFNTAVKNFINNIVK